MIEVRNRWTGKLVGVHTFHHNALTMPPVLTSEIRTGDMFCGPSVSQKEYPILQCALPTGVGFQLMKFVLVDDSNELRGDPQFLPLHG